MIAKTNQESSFAILGERRRDLFDLLKRAFEHPWVASYQIGFGPPLVRSSEQITRRVKETRTAIEKLKAYLDVCIFDETERKRLVDLHRRLLVKKQGPIEAEALDAASAEALDLTLRLHIPSNAPPKARGSMERANVDFGLVPEDTPPEIMAARFWVRLADPYHSRILHMQEVRALVMDAENAVALELRVPVALRPLYAIWVAELVKDSEYGFIDLEDPVAHARVRLDSKSL